MRVHQNQKPGVLGRTMRGEGGAGHGVIRGPGARAGSPLAQVRISDVRDGFDIRGRDRPVRSIALRLVAPDVRCAKKKVR